MFEVPVTFPETEELTLFKASVKEENGTTYVDPNTMEKNSPSGLFAIIVSTK